MSVEQLRITLAGAAEWLAQRPFGHPSWTCAACNRLLGQIENWSLAYDLACAEASRQRARDSVPW